MNFAVNLIILHMYYVMQKSMKILSLGQWPQANTRNKNIELTPITKRILSQVHLQPEQLLPISYRKFLRYSNSSGQGVASLDDYQDELQRRKKQVKILGQIRSNYIMGTDYGPFIQKIPLQLQNQVTKERVNSKCSVRYLRAYDLNESFYRTETSKLKTQKSSKLKELNICSRIKSKEKTGRKQNIQGQQLFYFGNITRKNTGSSYGKHSLLSSKKDSSQLRSLASKSKTNSMIHQQYGCLQTMKNGNINQRQQSNLSSKRSEGRASSDYMFQELLKVVQKWEKLDQQHAAEMEQLQTSSVKQRERLAKIHSIEKVQVRKQMDLIKKRLNSQTTSVQYSDALFF